MHTEGFHDLYFMSDMINVNKSRKMYGQDIWHEWEITGNTLSFSCKSTKEYIIWKT